MKKKVIRFSDKKWKCPSCGHENNYRQFEAPIGTDRRIEYCDVEFGGCDQPVLIRTDVKVTLKITPFEINDPDPNIGRGGYI